MSGASPYPGLRSFDRDEADVFFGRDRCLDGMAQTLQDTRFLAVLGPSGSGKSSLVRSGLFMHLEAGLAPKAGSRWTFLDIRHPRTQPFRELALATLAAERRRSAEADDAGEESAAAADEPGDAELDTRRKELRMGPLALARWWRETPHHPNENLLLLVDQFEELFGYTTPRERDEVESFIDLLLHTAANDEVDIYVVLTMRSEFLGGCALFPGLAEQINKSLSLTPRMTRDECRSAITGPAYGEALTLEPLLVTTLLNDMNSLAQFDEPAAGEDGVSGEAPAAELRQTDLIARRADQLPLMQHLLNWMWTLAAVRPRGPDEPIVLSLQDYLELGGLRGALSKHAHEVMDSTGDPELTSRIFRALTDQPTVATSGSAESSAVRRRRTLAQLAEESGASEDRVRAVVDAFRAEGVSMLTPDPTVRLTSDMEVDIAHESLIRQWSDLRGWIREEAEGGRAWQELLRDVGKGKQLRGLDLAERRGWWQRASPHAGWATRYGGEFETVDASLAADMRAERRRRIAGYMVTGALVLAGIGSTVLLSYTQVKARAAEEDRWLALRAQHDARIETAKAQRSAREAEKMKDREQRLARKLANAAQLSEAAARRAVAAAEATKVDAARRMQLAQAEVVRAHAAGEVLRAQSQALSTLVTKREYAHVQLIWGKTPAAAKEGFQDLDSLAVVLGTSDPEAFGELLPELERARGDFAAYQLRTDEMLTQAANVKEAVARDPSGPADQRTLRLVQAETLTGRGERMQGRPEAAVAAFDRAIDLGKGAESKELRLALAEAQYERASTQLDRGLRREAADAAGDCLKTMPEDTTSVLPVSMEPGSREAALFARPPFVQLRCHTILGAAAETDAEATRHWQEAVSRLAMFDESADMSLARSDMIVRYFRRPRKAALREMPEEIIMPLATALGNVLEEGEEGGMAISARPGDLYPLDALGRIRVNAEFVKWYFTESDRSLLDTEAVRRIMVFTQTLLPALADSGVGNAGLVASVSDTYDMHAANWIALERLGDPETAESLGSVVPQAADVIRRHWQFFRETVGDRKPDKEELARLRRLRAQAAELVEAGRAWHNRERYGTLSEKGRTLLTLLCGNSAFPADAACGRLETALAEVKAEDARLARSLAAAAPREGRSAEPAWADDGRFALAGFDPVVCFGARGALARAAETASQRNGAAAAPQADDGSAPAQDCKLRKGRLEYALHWGGQVWLFEREDNRKLFLEARGAQAPRFRGYDAALVAEGRKERPALTYRSGALVGGRLYLTDRSWMLTPELIARAEAAWPALRDAPEPAPQAPPAPAP